MFNPVKTKPERMLERFETQIYKRQISEKNLVRQLNLSFAFCFFKFKF